MFPGLPSIPSMGARPSPSTTLSLGSLVINGVSYKVTITSKDGIPSSLQDAKVQELVKKTIESIAKVALQSNPNTQRIDLTESGTVVYRNGSSEPATPYAASRVQKREMRKITHLAEQCGITLRRSRTIHYLASQILFKALHGDLSVAATPTSSRASAPRRRTATHSPSPAPAPRHRRAARASSGSDSETGTPAASARGHSFVPTRAATSSVARSGSDDGTDSSDTESSAGGASPSMRSPAPVRGLPATAMPAAPFGGHAISGGGSGAHTPLRAASPPPPRRAVSGFPPALPTRGRSSFSGDGSDSDSSASPTATRPAAHAAPLRPPGRPQDEARALCSDAFRGREGGTTLPRAAAPPLRGVPAPAPVESDSEGEPPAVASSRMPPASQPKAATAAPSIRAGSGRHGRPPTNPRIVAGAEAVAAAFAALASGTGST